MNDPHDWQILQEHHWYRIPVEKRPKRWPPKWLAFYQTKVFGKEAFAVRYYGRVTRIRQVGRRDLFPEEFGGPKADRKYFQIFLARLEKLPRPIVSKRLRLIVFIPTTMRKLMTAEEINDLFDDSPLEDAIWEEMKKLKLPAERQFYLKHKGGSYALDFAIFCKKGKIDVETDGTTWHSDPAKIPEDNLRNNALAAQGYQVLRFDTSQVREKLTEYCVPQIIETVNRLGGLADPNEPPRAYTETPDGIAQQMTLFEDPTAQD